jgi:hypothetical protein
MFEGGTQSFPNWVEVSAGGYFLMEARRNFNSGNGPKTRCLAASRIFIIG